MIHPAKLISNTISRLTFHVGSDNHNGAVADETKLAYNQIDSENWEFGLNLGDVLLPDQAGDTAYTNYTGQYDELTEHGLSDIYHFKGNHDDPKEADSFYFKKYLSPFNGDNSYFVNKPYPVTGTFEAYYITVGNMLIICIGDANNGAQPMGELGLGSGALNFRASGGITTAQWEFLKTTVENNTDKILVLCTHQGIKDTVIATGWKEFNKAFSRNEDYDPTGHYNVEDSHRMGYIAYINNWEGTINTTTGDSEATDEIKTWFETNGQYIDVCLSGHYHRKLNDEWNGRTRYEEKYGTKFLNCSVMNSKLHLYYLNLLELKSNFFNIVGDKLTVRTYIHKDPNSVVPVGFYEPEDLEITLKRKLIL